MVHFPMRNRFDFGMIVVCLSQRVDLGSSKCVLNMDGVIRALKLMADFMPLELHENRQLFVASHSKETDLCLHQTVEVHYHH